MLHIELKGNMVANNLPVTTLDSAGGVKTFFLKVVILHIKLKGMEHRTPCKQIVCPYTHGQMGSNWNKARSCRILVHLFHAKKT